jgi:polysaccharide pyruvyl transferase WcaK-like protein
LEAWLTVALKVTLSSISRVREIPVMKIDRLPKPIVQPMRNNNIRKIGVLGHVGNGNLGDEATFSAVIQKLQRRYSGVKICGFSLNPADTRGRHKIPAFPLRRLNNDVKQPRTVEQQNVSRSAEHTLFKQKTINKLKSIPLVYPFLKAVKQSVMTFSLFYQEGSFLLRSLERLRGFDLLVVAGAGQLADDFGGPWSYPYTLLKWSILAKIAKVKLIFLSLGVGPLNSALGRIFVKWALALAVYRSYRDHNSQRQIQEIGVAGENPIFPDLAYSLEIRPSLRKAAACRSQFIVGINVMPLYAGYLKQKLKQKDIYEKYVEALASFASWLLQAGYSVFFFPTQLRVDHFAILDVKAVINAKEIYSALLLNEPPIFSFDDLVRQIAKADIIVATRFHAILFSYLLNKPVLGISYNEKTDDLMAAVQQSDYKISITRCSVNLLVQKFNLLQSHCEGETKRLEMKVSEQRQALEEQYKHVFP